MSFPGIPGLRSGTAPGGRGAESRTAWPWLPGWVVSVCGPDEWEICVQAPELAMQHEGETVYPVCFRDASELRSLDAEPEAGS